MMMMKRVITTRDGPLVNDRWMFILEGTGVLRVIRTVEDRMGTFWERTGARAAVCKKQVVGRWVGWRSEGAEGCRAERA